MEGRLLRVVNPSSTADLRAFLSTQTARRFFADGSLARTTILEDLDRASLGALGFGVEEFNETQMVVEHQRVSFQSFPYEWPAEMLHAAGILTLELARESLNEGFGLKDATPYNVLFEGSQPVFVDLLSFERRNPGDSLWLAYAQFSRTFLLPLLVHRHCGMPLDRLFVTNREALEPEEVYALLNPLDRILPRFLVSVSIPTWLGARHSPDDISPYQPKLANPEKARFVLSSLLDRLGNRFARLEPPAKQDSRWAGYAESNNYSAEALEAKQRFIGSVFRELSPARVLDVGANQGTYSEVAARKGARVVAIDSDPVVMGMLWRRARAEGLNILPLVVNLTRPSPALGWRNEECPSFLDRARGQFDCVLMLALLHHLIVSERIPLADILDLAAELTTNLLVIEYVGPDDSMFRRIARGRDALHRDLTQAEFERACQKRFRIIRSQNLPGSKRSLYLLRKFNGLG
jgi:SAM-dependent methyltransferase